MSDEEQEETCVVHAYCVIYEMAQSTWQCMHEGWAQVNLYEDVDKTYRIVGWTLPDPEECNDDEEPEQEILINSNVTNFCAYSKKTPEFLKYVDEDKVTYGFHFYNKKEGDADDAKDEDGGDSKKFYSEVCDLIDRMKAEFGGEDDEDSLLAFNARTAKESSGTVKFVPANSSKAGTKLQIRQATLTKSVGGAKNISDVSEIKHLAHVKYDPASRSYKGLPPEWEALVHQQFGLEISRVECVKCPPYKSKIPSVLIQLKEYLEKHDAFVLEGLFRIAADQEECNFVKSLLNSNKFEKCEDIHCISTLIKQFYRDLPKPVMADIPPNVIAETATVDAAGGIVSAMPEPYCSVLLWLLDLGVDVSSRYEVNKMTPKNLAICISPNLIRPDMTDATAPMQYVKVGSFLEKAIVWRGRQKQIDLPLS